MSEERLKRLKHEKVLRAGRASLKKWKRSRAEFKERCSKGYEPAAGELANIIDGLTPDGYNRNGLKVSFIERGVSDSGKRIAGKAVIISK